MRVSTKRLETTDSIIFDPIMDDTPELLANPYPAMEQMRQLGGVVFSPKGNQWLVLGYDDANSILRSKKFGKKLLTAWKPPNLIIRGAMRALRRKQGSSMLIQDPPDHTRLRSLVNSAFTPGVIHSIEGHIESIADELIEKMSGRLDRGENVDLISEFAFPLPVIVIAELLGVPAENRAQFKKWSTDITTSFSGSVRPMKMAKSFMSIHSLRLYLKIIAEEKRHNPKDDLISNLVRAQAEDYEKLSNEELIANTVLILIAGHETTVNLIGNGVYNLLVHESELNKIKADAELIPNAVEEILRFDPPVQIVRRLALEDSTLGGKEIKAGDVLTVMTAACNRDPSINEDPATFDIEREQIKHLTFGAGIHYCLGAELARTEGRTALRKLFARFPDLCLADQDLKFKGPFSLRGFRELWVRRK